jgi:hypothetical protein
MEQYIDGKISSTGKDRLDGAWYDEAGGREFSAVRS